MQRQPALDSQTIILHADIDDGTDGGYTYEGKDYPIRKYFSIDFECVLFADFFSHRSDLPNCRSKAWYRIYWDIPTQMWLPSSIYQMTTCKIQKLEGPTTMFCPGVSFPAILCRVSA